jgi:hypothetical protein
VQPNEALLRMKAQCLQAGIQARGRWVREYDKERFSNEPEYGYNEQLQTCLYADSYSDSGAPLFPGVLREDHFVLDVFANKVILELTLHDGKVFACSGCGSEEEFADRKVKLFAVNARPR